MKERIAELLRAAVDALVESGDLPADAVDTAVGVGRARAPEHGDFSSNLALALARGSGIAPLDLARRLCAAMPPSALLSEVSAAPPGFINFRCAAGIGADAVSAALDQGRDYGRCAQPGGGRRVLLEFVSTNPTGPLHVGHGRGAAYGDSLARLLDAVGFEVRREYYINDHGRQADILALSLWLRYLECAGAPGPFPRAAYRGDYLAAAAQRLHAAEGGRYALAVDWVEPPLPADGDGTAGELRLDAMIARASAALGAARYAQLRDWALGEMLKDIRDDLDACGVRFDRWFSERDLVDTGACERMLARLESRDCLQRRDGALWFLSTRFGDDKDRVLVRENGAMTYFAVDIAYHLDKFERGFELLVDVWGADHHGYVPRLRAALQALDLPPACLAVRLVQLVSLARAGEPVAMSTRAGQFITLRALREEVGVDAMRLFFLLRRVDQPVEFDMTLAVSRSQDNPVYYIQYAHARLCSLSRKLERQGMVWDRAEGRAALPSLDEEAERQLMAHIADYPELVRRAAAQREPFLLVSGLRAAAAAFHVFYHRHQILCDDADRRNARLCLGDAMRQVLANGLDLLGIQAPESM